MSLTQTQQKSELAGTNKLLRATSRGDEPQRDVVEKHLVSFNKMPLQGVKQV